MSFSPKECSSLFAQNMSIWHFFSCFYLESNKWKEFRNMWITICSNDMSISSLKFVLIIFSYLLIDILCCDPKRRIRHWWGRGAKRLQEEPCIFQSPQKGLHYWFFAQDCHRKDFASSCSWTLCLSDLSNSSPSFEASIPGQYIVGVCTP